MTSFQQSNLSEEIIKSLLAIDGMLHKNPDMWGRIYTNPKWHTRAHLCSSPATYPQLLEKEAELRESFKNLLSAQLVTETTIDT